ncbi:MAG: SpoIIE family protein phosphatase [Acidobacteria bacterium]|nr:SpoIIE family protein phosphatase [Acidobacteriota bacterium]
MLVVALCLGLACAGSASDGAGHLRVRNYSFRDYASGGQNWAIFQDERGVLLVGNEDGLLEFDGETWRSIPMPRKTDVRAFARDGAGRVYVGAGGEFGYLETRPDGSRAYVSLRGRQDPGGPDFTVISTIVCLGGDVYFNDDNVLFRLRGGRIRAFKHNMGFGTCFVRDGRLYLCSSWQDLKELRGDEFRAIPVEGAKPSLVTVALPHPDGRVLLGTAYDACYLLDFTPASGAAPRATATPWKTEADELLRNSTLYTGTRLADGRCALGTNLGGVVILDPAGRVQRQVDFRDGLDNQEIQKIFQDREQNLWLALNNGLAWVDLASGFSRWNRAHGLKNVVTTTLRFEDRLYVGSFDGLHRLEDNRVVNVPGVRGGAICLLRFTPPDEPGRAILLAGTTESGLCEVGEDRAVPVIPGLQVACLLQPRRDPSRLYLATPRGLAVAVREKRRWRLLDTDFGVVDFVDCLAEDAGGALWFNTSSLGVHRLENGRAVRFGPDRGLPDASERSLWSARGDLYVSVAGGVYRYDPARRRFEPSDRVTGVLQGRPRMVGNLFEAPNGWMWAQGNDARTREGFLGAMVPGPGGTSRWVEGPFNPLRDILLNDFTLEPDGTVWIAADQGLYRYRGPLAAPSAPFDALVRRARFGLDTPDGLPVEGAVHAGAAGGTVLDYRRNSARFDFAAPSWSSPNGVEYRTRLEGFDAGWSAWSRETKREYTNLPERAYCFRVQARNVYGQFSTEAICEFTVRAPWYRTPWAYLGYALLAVGLVWGLSTLNTTRLRRAKARLERTVEERTAEITAQKEVIEEKSRNITKSILYASRIQRAMLPPEGALDGAAADHFLLYRPRDIVSGDFFWSRQVGRQVFLVAADCTGHGVPGAFMSVLGISLLNEIVAGLPVLSPEEILGRLRERVVQSLRQTGEEGSSRDGLDIALCAVDLDRLTLRYAGAHRPLWLFRAGDPDGFVEVKGDRMPVGYHHKKGAAPFAGHTLQLDRGDTIYLFSDGFASQFGGADGDSFKASRLRDTLRALWGKPMSEQRDALEKVLSEWMAGHEQVDDILVLGVRL